MHSYSAARLLRSIRPLASVAVLSGCAWAVLPAETALMPLDEVKAGMTGTGHTVFQGTELQEFKVHILGVLRNVQGAAAEPDPREARRWAARRHRRHCRDERQPGVH